MGKVLKLSKSKVRFSEEELQKLAKEYNELSNTIKTLQDRKTEIANIIKEEIEDLGTKDDKGSFYYESDEFLLGKVSRKSISIKQKEAVDFLKHKGHPEAIHTEIVETVIEKELEKLVVAGEIDSEEVKDLMDVKVSYSVLVNKLEALPNIEETTLKASKRK